ncbi:MAG: 16S rRNA (cytidine(1402)-2'-O)-methyltransferase [Actinomycetia bacterium]|nr:16S rRNA (cytidine(1402)-2'-O)-methyltransferase [Actinomycetes bacterium]
MPNQESGFLVLAGTPIGDVSDASPRLRALLMGADVVAAEDTRRLRRLAAALEVEIAGKVVSYHEHNEGARTRDLVARMAAGQTVLLVTDAGMPSVSDPGYRLVAAAIEADIRVTTAPGPSAVLAALAVSGLPVDRFCFEGFLPRKGGQRRERLRGLVHESRTMVFFEAPHRLAEVLSDMAELWGDDRAAAVCRELTKTYEEVKRGGLAALAKWAGEGVRGEITLIVTGASAAAAEMTDDELREAVRALETSGSSRRDAVDAVSAATGLSRRRVYNAAIN